MLVYDLFRVSGVAVHLASFLGWLLYAFEFVWGSEAWNDILRRFRVAFCQSNQPQLHVSVFPTCRHWDSKINILNIQRVPEGE